MKKCEETGKTCYVSQAIADRETKRLSSKRYGSRCSKMRSYFCDSCKGYHITSHNQQGKT